MSPTADPAQGLERLRALLARWQQSLELHARYLPLDDAHYFHVQPWPPHERPAAWIIALARQKLSELSRSLEEHAARGDASYTAGLEHMLFLANLVGFQPASRYIPLADPQAELPDVLAATLVGAGAAAPPAAPNEADLPTREMPRLKVARPAARTARTARGATATARSGRHAAPAAPATPPLDARARQVIEDAVRLLQWGRKWHELGELISRLSGRPTVGDTRRILRSHRPAIEAAAGGGGAPR